LTGVDVAVGSRRIGKRITLSRPRMESFATESVGRTELLGAVLRAVDPGDFLRGVVRVVVDRVVVDEVVVTSVSTTVAAGAAVEEAVAVSAADCSGRAQAVASTTVKKAPARDSLVTDRFPESSEAL
jgi:hypothetical protein